MSTAEKDIIEILTEFGLSANAGKTYVALLGNNPATGYEICTQSGIPRSAIYAVLNKLETLGIVNSIGDSPRRFVPIPPSSLLEHFKQLHNDRLGLLEDALTSIDTEEKPFDFWHLHGYKNLILKLREGISKARQTIFLSVWAKELLQLEDDLAKAEEQGVKITIFSFTKIAKEYGNTISYNLDETELEKVWNPKVILVIDRQITVMGSAVEKNKCRAIWTNNRAITEIATNHIVLDITLAGQRLEFDPNPVVKSMMRRPDKSLEQMLQSNK